MYVPPSAHSALLHLIHSSPLSGHMGVFCTKSVLERDFWWPGLSTFVKHFIVGCTVCQQNKVNTHPMVPPLCPILSTVSLPFKQLSVNLITNLSLSSGFDSVMVVVNHGLTKRVILTPCSKTVDAAGIAQLFFDFVFKQFGLHNTLISDRGPQFTSAFAKEFACLLKYNVHLSTAYHPQMDGQTKQTNQKLETYLRIFCTNNPTKWVQFLPSTEFHHNSAPQKLSFLLSKNDYPDLMKPKKRPLPLMTPLENSCLPELLIISILGKLEIRSGSKLLILDCTILPGNLPPKDMVPSKSSRYYLPLLTNSDFPPHGRYMIYSMPPSYLLIAPPNPMVPPSLCHLLTSLIMKKNMKSKPSSLTRAPKAEDCT